MARSGAFLGPGTVVASLTMETPGRVGLIVAERPSSVYSTPLRTIVEESVVHAHARPDTKSLCRPGSEADVSDLVRVMTIRARGHFCLHAAMLPTGTRGGSDGSSGQREDDDRTALLRGGFYMFSDELSVLHADAQTGSHDRLPLRAENCRRSAGGAFGTEQPCNPPRNRRVPGGCRPLWRPSQERRG